MATSPGRSAIQTMPKAAAATSVRKNRTRIIPKGPSRHSFQRSDRVGGKLAGRLDRLAARFQLGDPRLSRYANVRRKLRKLRRCAVDIALCGALLGPGQRRIAVIAARLADRTD